MAAVGIWESRLLRTDAREEAEALPELFGRAPVCAAAPKRGVCVYGLCFFDMLPEIHNARSLYTCNVTLQARLLSLLEIQNASPKLRRRAQVACGNDLKKSGFAMISLHSSRQNAHGQCDVLRTKGAASSLTRCANQRER